uniref:NADH dehydrogenase subunit 6 n=1 Tax=Leptotrombidium akamushi TaxID=299468 RepID=Q3C2I7_9ACAR|nr:NADH dehydrogenase subunit 6 [Leptotrombidium akamushi]BAE47110.1 NADH dehydrogenase subunit 6 [Leptotrombidium akamushi]
MSIFSLYPILGIKHLSSSSPMKVLLAILFLVWNISMLFFEKGQDFWVPIFIIMLFNGGLMILFLFTVSMIPKEKSMDLFNMPMFLFFSLLFILMNAFEEKKSLSDFFFQNWWMILFSSLFMLIYFISISMLTIDFFKTIKSL